VFTTLWVRLNQLLRLAIRSLIRKSAILRPVSILSVHWNIHSLKSPTNHCENQGASMLTVFLLENLKRKKINQVGQGQLNTQCNTKDVFFFNKKTTTLSTFVLLSIPDSTRTSRRCLFDVCLHLEDIFFHSVCSSAICLGRFLLEVKWTFKMSLRCRLLMI